MGIKHSILYDRKKPVTVYAMTNSSVDLKNLEDTSVIAATSIMQSTKETPAQIVAKVDFLLRQKVRHIEILAADTLQLPNMPLIIFLQDLKKLSDQKSKLSDTELNTQYTTAVEKFKNNVEKVKKHFIGLKILIGMLNTLNSETLSQSCKDKGILSADDELMTVLSEAGKSWSQEVKKALEERFDRKVVDCFISFKTWEHYQGNPWGEKKTKDRFILYLKFLQSVQTRFNSEGFSSCKRSVNQHAAVVSIERYKEMISQYIDLVQPIKHTEIDGAILVSVEYGTEIGKAFKENRKKLESGDTTSTSFLSDHKDAFTAYASLTGYDIQTAIELSELYLLSELAVFDMFRSRCRVAQQDAAIKSVDVIAYNGPMTPSVAAYYKARNLTHLEGRDTPVLQWLALQYQTRLPSERSGAFGQSAKDAYFDQSVLTQATKLLKAQPAQESQSRRGGFIMSYGNHNSAGKASEESDLDLERLREIAMQSFSQGFDAATFAFFRKKLGDKKSPGPSKVSDPMPIISRKRSDSGDSVGDPSPPSSPRASLTALPSLEKQENGDHREKQEDDDMQDSQISPPTGEEPTTYSPNP